ncbi:hypothetical protein [Sutterella sp.]|uniref:hypothetical protein n=1 Tax=Sutterella sp. TaxID=1981025 RepID=UPI0026DEC524|nr:hypothetical protein [Sutterella sp.]MDO5531601.1 hypothetical protein [Sutterella sp.]
MTENQEKSTQPQSFLRDIFTKAGECSGIDAALRASFGADAELMIEFARAISARAGHSIFCDQLWSEDHDPDAWKELLKSISNRPKEYAAFYSSRARALKADPATTAVIEPMIPVLTKEGNLTAGRQIMLIAGKSREPVAAALVPAGRNIVENREKAFAELGDLANLVEASTPLVSEGYLLSTKDILDHMVAPRPLAYNLEDREAQPFQTFVENTPDLETGGEPVQPPFVGRVHTVEGMPGVPAAAGTAARTRILFNPEIFRRELEEQRVQILDVKAKLGGGNRALTPPEQRIMKEMLVREEKKAAGGKKTVKWRIDEEKLRRSAVRQASRFFVMNTDVPTEDVMELSLEASRALEFYFPDMANSEEYVVNSLLEGYDREETYSGRAFLQFAALAYYRWILARFEDIVSRMEARGTSEQSPAETYLVAWLQNECLFHDGQLFHWLEQRAAHPESEVREFLTRMSRENPLAAPETTFERDALFLRLFNEACEAAAG